MIQREYDFLKDNNFIPSKKMGQNFLLDDSIQKKIVSLAKVKNKNVIEIGPGLGAITRYIVKEAKSVIAIELDKRLFEYVNKTITNKNFKIINNDILKTDINKILKNSNIYNAIVVSNLPYSITTPILLKLLKTEKIKKIVVMVQKELAERICSKENSKNYSSFSCLLNHYFVISHLFDVNKNSFYPRPMVDSSVIELIRKNIDNNEVEEFSSFLRKCFLSKRKKLINNLKSTNNSELISDFLLMNNIPYDVRAEKLSSELLYNLYKFLKLNSQRKK